MTKEQVLQKCTIDGTVVKLPAGQLERKLYQDVAKSLELIGGKWKGGKTMGFVFELDPAELLEQIANGDKRNLKKEFQFFATPDALADKLVQLAELKNGMCVLEPSAGQGAIISAIYKAFPRYMKGPNDQPSITVDYCELMEVNRKILSKKISDSERWSSSTSWMGDDFLQFDGKYQRIIANPPFNKNQDIDHIKKMYDCLKLNGRLVSIASKHWQNCSNKKEKDFKDWLCKINAIVEDVPAGAFKESGTNISSVIIIIDK